MWSCPLENRDTGCAHVPIGLLTRFGRKSARGRIDQEDGETGTPRVQRRRFHADVSCEPTQDHAPHAASVQKSGESRVIEGGILVFIETRAFGDEIGAIGDMNPAGNAPARDRLLP